MTQLVEELRCAESGYKAEIRRRSDGLYQVFLFCWVEDSTREGELATFWSEVGTGASIADALESARSIAVELLRTSGS